MKCDTVPRGRVKIKHKFLGLHGEVLWVFMWWDTNISENLAAFTLKGNS
jgi:hypothetical protein